MKKILALVLALTLVFALSACGGKTEEPTTEATTAADAAGDVTAEATEAASADATEAASADATEAASADATEAASADATEAASDAATTAAATDAATTKAADTKGLNSTDAAAVVAFYNKAVKATEKSAPKGQSTMKLDGGITGDGGLGAVLKVASPIIESTLERNSTSTDYIPGHEADLLASDVKSASAVSKNGVTTITIQLKDQTDGPNADAHTAGPVARGIGTLGNIQGALDELGAELYSGKDTIKLLYNNAYIKCTVDENTGKITGGTWHYKVNVTVGDAELKLVLKFNAKNLKAVIDYTIVL